MERSGYSRTAVAFVLSAFLVLIAWSCASSSRDESDGEGSRFLAMTPDSFLPPKTEIAFPPLPLARRRHAIHGGSGVGGYELRFADRQPSPDAPKSPGYCRLTCIGGDCAITDTSESQFFLQQGTFVVTYSRIVERSKHLVAFLASLNRTFGAPLVFLECAFDPRTGGKVTLGDLLAQLPPDTRIDAKKNARLTLTESLPTSVRYFEYATNRCRGKAGNPYPKAAIFALTSKGIVSYDSRGAPLDYKIQCRGPVGTTCAKISDFLETNGADGCVR